MSISTTLAQLITDFEARTLPAHTPRHTQLPALPGKADAVIGIRRCGKTTLLLERIRALEASGVPRSRILYLNFEDDRLFGLTAEDLGQVDEIFFRRNPGSRTQECFFFFDEIQVVEGWERYVRRLLDSDGVRVVLTGSSAKLLSRELATSLRGRSLATELWPFSFAEALAHQGVTLPQTWPVSAERRSQLQHAFGRYLEVGGFPEVQRLERHDRVRVLQDYVDAVVFRDIVDRHGVSNTPALRYLVRRLAGGPAARFSINRFYNDLRSQGFRLGKDTLYRWFDWIEDAFLVATLPIRTRSERVRQTNPKKAYVVDPGLARAMSYAAEDVGHLLENVVYLALRRQDWKLAYGQTASGFEVDFVGARPGGERTLVQVAARLDSAETRDRELRALREGMGEHGVTEGTIVTLVEDEVIETDEGTVRVVPAWRWLLQEDRAPESG